MSVNKGLPQFNYNAGIPHQQNPYGYNTYPYYAPPQYQQQTQQQAQQPVNSVQVAYVNGVEGAKAYVVLPKQRVLLLDDENMMSYFKESDEQGKSTIEAFQMTKIEVNNINKPDTTQFVTKTEFNNFVNEIKSILKPQTGSPDVKVEGDTK